MSKEELFLAFVQAELAIEYDRAGRSATARAVNAALRNEKLDMVSSKAGSSFTVAEALALIFEFVVAAHAAYQIIDIYQSQSPQTKELKTIEEIKAIIKDKLTKKQRDMLSDRLLMKIIAEVRSIDAR